MATAERVRFGVFEADLRSGELYRHGRKIKLHQQPFQVLTLLIEHPGEVVTREELRQKLWSSDTFVNFDIGLNSAVRKLRGALNDSAESPRYVETLHKRGYRFIAPVTIVARSYVEPESEIPNTQSDKTAGLERPVPVAPSRARRRSLTWAAVIAALAVFISLAWLRVGNHGARSFSEPGSVRIRSLAVLPLDNLSGNVQQDYLADGITEALTTNLGEISSLTVISRHSTARYKGTKKGLSDIAQELNNVDGFVTGAVTPSGDRVNVYVHLVDAASGRLLWSHTYERGVRDVIGVTGEITRAVAHEIQATLTPEQQAHLLRLQSVDPETYELYARGRALWTKLPDDSPRSIEYFKQAIQRQPRFAAAYAALAEAYDGASEIAPSERFSKAKNAAYKALQLDETLPEAHNALAGSLFWYDWNWADAEKEFRRAIALNPNYAPAHQFYGQYLKAMGRKNWVDEVKRAAELDPVTDWFAGGDWYVESGDYDKYINLQQKKLELNPSSAALHARLARGYILKHEYPAAIESLKQAVSLSGGTSSDALARLGYAYGVSGRREDALDVLRRLDLLSKQRYVHPVEMAIVYSGLGETDRAFEWLNKAYADRDPRLVMNRLRDLESLRSDPRFAELKRKVGLPE